MGESLNAGTWQETVDTAVARLEAQTGLALAGLSQMEITFRVRAWMRVRDQAKLAAPPPPSQEDVRPAA